MDIDQRIAESHNNLREVASHGPVKFMMIEGQFIYNGREGLVLLERFPTDIGWLESVGYAYKCYALWKIGLS